MSISLLHLSYIFYGSLLRTWNDFNSSFYVIGLALLEMQQSVLKCPPYSICSVLQLLTLGCFQVYFSFLEFWSPEWINGFIKFKTSCNFSLFNRLNFVSHHVFMWKYWLCLTDISNNHFFKKPSSRFSICVYAYFVGINICNISILKFSVY